MTTRGHYVVHIAQDAACYLIEFDIERIYWTTCKCKADKQTKSDPEVALIPINSGQCSYLVIVSGAGSRSYWVSALPDPTGYYYCTLQLGCCIVEAICSVHLEVN